MEYIKDFGIWLKQIRETCDPEGPLNLSDFADKLDMGWDKTIISKIESGNRSLKADEFLYICEKFEYEFFTKKEIWEIRYNANALKLQTKSLKAKVEKLEKENDFLKKRLENRNNSQNRE